jgi:hypothetical protein
MSIATSNGLMWRMYIFGVILGAWYAKFFKTIYSELHSHLLLAPCKESWCRTIGESIQYTFVTGSQTWDHEDSDFLAVSRSAGRA